VDARASVAPGTAPRITITPERRKIDAVFEGGGVRGIGLVGAIRGVESAGYTCENVAGTSAGAIVATLLAAGYGAAEVKEVINSNRLSQDHGHELLRADPRPGGSS
jgi:predicted acylesterase/phospholipase RssA